MKAMIMTAFGGPEVLQMGDWPDPEPQSGDLLVRVEATAINPVDCKTRQAPRWGDRTAPMILGYDLCGEVIGLGKNTTGFEVGDRIMASPNIIREGAYAEQVTIDHRTAIHVPDSLSSQAAAALPLVTLTAWESLHDHARVKSGESILIHAGAGGVGHIAIQHAKAAGLHVITTAGRDESEALCHKVGADQVLRYDQSPDLPPTDIVLDLVGGEVFESAVDSVAPRGRIVTIVPGVPGDAVNRLFAKNASVHFEFMGAALMQDDRPERHAETLTAAIPHLTPHISKTYDLTGIPAAHQAQESGRTLGKQVIQVS